MKSITADIKGLLIQSKISKKAGYKRANSFCPLRESKESVRDDGSVFINDICYSEKYPNSFFDVFYPQGKGAKLPTLIYFHGGGYKVYENAEKKSAKDQKPAVSDFCMEIQDKEFIVFVGPSGCGKSTTLRMIAGLEEITDGEVWIDDVLVNDIAPKDRDIAMVFQNYALYPHMTVYDNMAFGLKLRKIADVKRDKQGNPVLDENGNQIPVMRKYTKKEIDDKVQAAAKILAMDSVGKHMDTGMGLLINTPGLPSSKANGLPAGYSENGGIFCQANCWAIMAEAILGRGNNAWKYYKQLIPHEIIKRIGVDSYRGEAYAYSSTMLGPANEKFGQACVSQVTGTSAWMDVVSTQYLLGIRPTLGGLLIDPAIPCEWNGFSVERIYHGCRLHIEVENPEHIQKGVRELYLDGKRLCDNIISPELLKDKTVAEIKAVMG